MDNLSYLIQFFSLILQVNNVPWIQITLNTLFCKLGACFVHFMKTNNGLEFLYFDGRNAGLLKFDNAPR